MAQFGDDGDGGGFGAALADAFSAGGAEQDANMAHHGGRRGKGKRGSNGSGNGKDEYGGFDVTGAESAIKTGGAGGLMTMLKAMTMLNHRDPNVVQDSSGADVYDFRDQDIVKRDKERARQKEANKTSTLPPTTTKAPHQAKAAPTPAPAAGSRGVQHKGTKQHKKSKKISKACNDAPAAAMLSMADMFNDDATTLPPCHSAAPKKAVAVTVAPPTTAPIAVPTAAPVVIVAAPSIPIAQVATQQAVSTPGQPVAAGAAPANVGGLYQGMAVMNQNINALIGQVAAIANQANTAPLAAKLDQASKDFLSYETRMEARVDSLQHNNEVLKEGNSEMKTELETQQKEIKALEEEAKKQVQDEKEMAQEKVQLEKLQQDQKSKALEQAASVKPNLRGKSLQPEVQKADQAAAPKATTEVNLPAEKNTQESSSGHAEAQSTTKFGFAADDVVTWTDADDDIPRGTQGTVTGSFTDERVEVKFPAGTYDFLPSELQKVETTKAAVSALSKDTSIKKAAVQGVDNQAVNIRKQATTAGAHAANDPWDATFSVHLDGKVGGATQEFTIRVHPDWAPEGAKRFREIVYAGILKDARFFRVVPGFMAQFGIPGSPKVAAAWAHKAIPDDPVKQSNTRGTLTFAKAGANSRTTQMFFNYVNNDFLDAQGFAPFAEVLGDGMNMIDKIETKYREKPDQHKIQRHGNRYLMKHFPKLSFVDHVVDAAAGTK